MKFASILLAIVALSGTAQPIIQSKSASADKSNIDNAKILAKSTHVITAAAEKAKKDGKNPKEAAKKVAH